MWLKLTKFGFQNLPLRNLLAVLQSEKIFEPNVQILLVIEHYAKTIVFRVQGDHVLMFRVQFFVDIETRPERDAPFRGQASAEFLLGVVVLQPRQSVRRFGTKYEVLFARSFHLPQGA